MVKVTDTKAVAPTPPVGPTTYTSLAAMIVGIVIAILSLFDVVPTADDVQSLGVIVGGVLAAVAYVVSAVSRTKQANNLAKIAQEQANNLAKIAQGERLAKPAVLTQPVEAKSAGGGLYGDSSSSHVGVFTGSGTRDLSAGITVTAIGEPEAPEQEVPAGSVPTPADAYLDRVASGGPILPVPAAPSNPSTELHP